MKVFKIVSVIAFFLVIAYAQISLNDGRLSPKLLNYQGYLTDTLGIPIYDSLDMTFKIFDASSSGNELWSETQTNVPIEHGVFSVVLGEGTTIPDSVFMDFQNTWLELTLEGPQTLTPRTRIASAFYALYSSYAGDADLLDGMNSSAFVEIDGDTMSGLLDVPEVYTSEIIGPAAADQNRQTDAIVFKSSNTVSDVTRLSVTASTGPASLADVRLNESRLTFSSGSELNLPAATSTREGAIWYTGGNVQYRDASTTKTLLTTDNSGDNDWSVTDSVLYTGNYWGLARGSADNELNGDSTHTHVVFGAACTTGSAGINARYTTIGGGLGNRAYGYATVCGGSHNKAGAYASVGGGSANTADSIGTFIGGGSSNRATDDYAVVCGGMDNEASGPYSFIGGGTSILASGNCATVSGGNGSVASGDFATVAGGVGNYASGASGTVSGGESNRATSNYAFVGGGYYNRAEALYAAIGGGYRNRVLGDYSGILGGYADTITATGDYSYLFGINSNLTQDSTFMVDLPHIRFGTEAAGYEFPVVDGASGQVMVTDGSGQLSWDDAPANDTDWVFSGSDLYSGVSGNVGIGNTSPNYKLDVTGNIRGTGVLYIEDIHDDAYYLDPDDAGWSAYVAGNIACLGGAHVGGSGGVLDDNLIVDGNTSLGISSSAHRLYVNGDMRLTSVLYDENGTSGTSGQVLSASGTGVEWVDAPPQVSFCAYNTASDPIGSGWNKVEFNMENHDDGNRYNNVTDQFTAPSDGAYLFSANVAFEACVDGRSVVIALYKNGSRYIDLATGYTNTANSPQGFGGSATIKLAANDYIEVYTYNNGAATYHSGASMWTNFSGHQIY